MARESHQTVANVEIYNWDNGAASWAWNSNRDEPPAGLVIVDNDLQDPAARAEP